MAIRRLKRYSLLFFPALMILGKICSYSMPANYFSDKHNVFNQYFVKLGWFWTTLAFWAPYITWPKEPIQGLNKPGMRGVVLRYAVATLWWIFFAQWFFGAPVMDRIFLLTGGSCVVNEDVVSAASSSRVCRSKGGSWVGGHDPSGHFFLLMQSSMLLLQENLPYLYYLFTAENAVVPWSFKFTLVLLNLWIWMFFITSIYFHSFSEKLSGLAFGYVEIIFVYYLGERYPWGELFGIPELDTEAVKPTPVPSTSSSGTSASITQSESTSETTGGISF